MNTQKLLEAVADISYQAGQQNFFSGNSRLDITEFIRWAYQFEKENLKTDWTNKDYITTIENFTAKKIAEASDILHQT